MKNTAIVTAVHRDRYELGIGSETTYGRLKTAAFYNSGEIAMFPTVGDRVEALTATAQSSRLWSGGRYLCA